MGVFDMGRFGISTYSALIQYIFGINDENILFHLAVAAYGEVMIILIIDYLNEYNIIYMNICFD